MHAIGTIINKKGKTIGVFQVKPEIIQNCEFSRSYRQTLRQRFSSIHIILLSQNARGELIFDGDDTLINEIKEDNLADYNWRQYKL